MEEPRKSLSFTDPATQTGFAYPFRFVDEFEEEIDIPPPPVPTIEETILEIKRRDLEEVCSRIACDKLFGDILHKGWGWGSR